MIKKTIHQRLLILAVLPALLLASCSKEEVGGEPGTQNGEIRFEIGFASTDGAVQTAPETRVATDTKFRSTWEDGDAIGIFAAEHGTALAATGNTIHNVKLTYSSANGGTWTPAEPLYWMAGSPNLDFYAYYPYDETRTDPLAISFSVPTDQSATTTGGPVYNRNDLLMAKAGNKGKGETVALNFSHALAMVQVNVSKSMVGNYAPEALIVRLNGCATGCVLNLFTQATAQPSEPLTETIKMYPCPNDGDVPGVFAYRALMPVQTIAAGTVMFSSEYDGNSHLHSRPLAQALPLSAGQAETFDMRFPFTSVTLSETKRLADLLTADELASILHLKVLGEMTEVDFNTICYQMSSITNLDLSGATVKGNKLPDYALIQKSGLVQFIFPQGITSIGKYAFHECENITGLLEIPDSVTSIGVYAFFQCKGFTGSLKIPDGVTSIGECAFYNCEGFNGSLKIPEGVQTIGNSAFNGCKGFNGTLTIPDGVTTIGDFAFFQCEGFTGSLKIPEGVQTIGNSAFLNCKNFNGRLTIPASITRIDDFAFTECVSITSITCHIPDLTKVEFGGHGVFSDIPNDIPVYVPSEMEAEYQSHATWSTFTNIQAIPQP